MFYYSFSNYVERWLEKMISEVPYCELMSGKRLDWWLSARGAFAFRALAGWHGLSEGHRFHRYQGCFTIRKPSTQSKGGRSMEQTTSLVILVSLNCLQFVLCKDPGEIQFVKYLCW